MAAKQIGRMQGVVSLGMSLILLDITERKSESCGIYFREGKVSHCGCMER